jgi:hypothetical protein
MNLRKRFPLSLNDRDVTLGRSLEQAQHCIVETLSVVERGKIMEELHATD